MKINQDIEPDPEQEFDIEGTLLYALGLVAFMYGMSVQAVWSGKMAHGCGSAAAGWICLP